MGASSAKSWDSGMSVLFLSHTSPVPKTLGGVAIFFGRRVLGCAQVPAVEVFPGALAGAGVHNIGGLEALWWQLDRGACALAFLTCGQVNTRQGVVC